MASKGHININVDLVGALNTIKEWEDKTIQENRDKIESIWDKVGDYMNDGINDRWDIHVWGSEACIWNTENKMRIYPTTHGFAIFHNDQHLMSFRTADDLKMLVDRFLV